MKFGKLNVSRKNELLSDLTFFQDNRDHFTYMGHGFYFYLKHLIRAERYPEASQKVPFI